MNLSPNARYAIRLLFELDGINEPVSIATLAERTGMSPRTVENIHAELRQNGITSGTIGAKGGIRLISSLKEISLGDIVSIFEDGVKFLVCCGDKANNCPNQKSCGIRLAWEKISDQFQENLDQILLRDILDQYPRAAHGPLLNKFLDE